MSPRVRRKRVGELLDAVDDLPLARSFADGVSAFVGGLVLLGAVVGITGSLKLGKPAQLLRELAYVFFNAQNVPLAYYRETIVGDQVIVQEGTRNLLQGGGTTLPPMVYYALPVVAIAGIAGFLALRHVRSGSRLAHAGSLVGGFTLGYVLAALVAALLTGQRATNGEAVASLAPDMLLTLGMGIAYPLVVSTTVVGLAVAWRRRSDPGGGHPNPQA